MIIMTRFKTQFWTFPSERDRPFYKWFTNKPRLAKNTNNSARVMKIHMDYALPADVMELVIGMNSSN